MTVDEIIRKIQELSLEEREILRRELEETIGKPEAQCATPETATALKKEQQSSGDERGIPIEDVVRDPK